MIALKIIGWVLLGFVLFQALFNPWTPIFYIWRRWVSEIQTWIKDKIQTPFSEEGGIFKITLNDFKWENFVEADLFEFKKKYIWSRKPTWVMLTGGAAHIKSDSIHSWVYEWLKNHPDAKVENNCKVYILPTKLELAEEDKKHLLVTVDTLKERIKLYIGKASAYTKMRQEKNYSKHDELTLFNKTEECSKKAQKIQDTLINVFLRINELDNESVKLKTA